MVSSTVGSLAAIYFTDVLKKLINQERPEGSILADPGMPSSHALTSFFLALSWMTVIDGMNGLLFASAASVAGLRVVCGYHTISQITVGASIGSSLGYLWVSAGKLFYSSKPRLAWGLAWSAYLAGSLVYIFDRMHKWVGEDKHM